MYSLAGENLLRRKYQIFLYHFMNKILGLSRPARRVSIRSSVSLSLSQCPTLGWEQFLRNKRRERQLEVGQMTSTPPHTPPASISLVTRVSILCQ